MLPPAPAEARLTAMADATAPSIEAWRLPLLSRVMCPWLLVSTSTFMKVQRSTGFTSANPHIRLLVWERTTAPKRFYAIAAYDAVHTATADGRKYRPLESVFTRER